MRGVLTKDESASSYHGLDVIIMTPPIQGGGQGPSFLKLKASKMIDVCISWWTIQAWLGFRQASKQKREVLRTNHRPLFRSDFTPALNKAIPDDHLLQTITASLATAVTEEGLIENEVDADLNSLIWIGNMTARI